MRLSHLHREGLAGACRLTGSGEPWAQGGSRDRVWRVAEACHGLSWELVSFLGHAFLNALSSDLQLQCVAVIGREWAPVRHHRSLL